MQKVLQPYNICSFQTYFYSKDTKRNQKIKKTLGSSNANINRKNFTRNLQNKHATKSIRKKNKKHDKQKKYLKYLNKKISKPMMKALHY